ncbi:MAG TPA: hypothetical protein VFS23_40530 [Vicinamibacterales bacterium]|nr:hypothetical protein [Vicinamibacterales bacterium]
MPAILASQVTAFFLYDAAELIDLAHVATLVGGTTRVRLTPKTTTPSYVQYQQPPLTLEGAAIGVPDALGFTVRFKLFDYGVISVALARPLPGTWAEVIECGLALQDDPRLASTCESLCRDLIARLRPALTSPHDDLVSEDYIVYAISELEDRPTAQALIEQHGDDIVRLLRGEREALSRQEREEVLRHRISYFEHDLLVPTWNAVFVYDNDGGIAAASEIFEFANSQLLEFRYYDDLLARELARIYADLQKPAWFRGWGGRRYTRAAQQVHALFIDVNELTDRAENALKVAGDIYTARVLTLAGARLGLDQWRASVQDKLKTLDDIYRFAVEQTGMARGEALELMIVLILVFELILFFMGIMR